MLKIDDLEKEIQDLREKLTELIMEKENLLDPQVVAASKMLDSILNKYSEIIDSSTKR
ncbi:putative nuclease with TOPRIM domain [Clostridium acetobutylicum]|uniref:Spo0E like sporulation regulatory protein n=1 Tax=Clostridium acetobutylicum (strain ATCC 824 / DSM 792 / JCM 1419 / IAM 19013 / LMG 5710 / NBRC 13948 / NRRL B-527 / VKM B-1787 / 2291 / W) TaxID=272562 RepID=Q97JF8_CLOAB|nr:MULTISPECIES: aspartyl-phosphate phosphatase Spo0E family protein [Clostridium]AAK79296.1 Hypothetical protein CA_C1327 [Clostridium acetobutylicum ATCC 824]ADZ20378.1 Conserved hypothetical protein [Clostridium acetobutylicum EA 2018]AEI31768.1 hypothetical protein SMB_G1350 [Clostridium acetobutylicum DSM 1731]AWV81454.1 aspartyl-phosphate phosphatase Spo0E family protein [Clostridium acetobutylicum]KHD36073.1 sporulation protein Spo0E [Clostridium acetobutylicum]